MAACTQKKETIKDGAENVVIIEPIDECLIERSSSSVIVPVNDRPEFRSVGANAPDLARKTSCCGCRALSRGDKKDPGCFGKGTTSLAAVVFDRDVGPLRCRWFGVPYSPHGPQLDQVAIRQKKLANAEKSTFSVPHGRYSPG